MIKAIIFDFGYTLLDEDKGTLYLGVTKLLDVLEERHIDLALTCATDKEELRREQLNESGIFPYFKYVHFQPVEEPKNFEPILEQFNLTPEEILVVGDRITREITSGKKLGMKTCRILNGPEKNLVPDNELEIPDYTIEKLSEIILLLSS